MGKPEGHSLKDVTIKQSSGSFINGLSSKPAASNRDDECRLDLNLVEGKLEVHDKKGPAKKGKSKTVETVSASATKDTYHVTFEPIFMRRSSSHELTPRLSLCSRNKKNKTCKQEDSLLQSQQGPNYGSASALECERGRGLELILMSCLNCYLHVMVCDANPKCPKCGRGDCLLDMYRA